MFKFYKHCILLLVTFIYVSISSFALSMAKSEDFIEGRVIGIQTPCSLVVKNKDTSMRIVKLYGIECPDEGHYLSNESYEKLKASSLNKLVSINLKYSSDQNIGQVIIQDYFSSNVKSHSDKKKSDIKDIDLSAMLLSLGLAWASTGDNGYKNIESSAKALKIGMWKDNNGLPFFNVIELAKLESNINGVLAGFAIAIAILLIQIWHTEGQKKSLKLRMQIEQPVTIFISAFFSSILTSVLFAVTASENIPSLRAYILFFIGVESFIISIIFIVSGVIMSINDLYLQKIRQSIFPLVWGVFILASLYWIHDFFIAMAMLKKHYYQLWKWDYWKIILFSAITAYILYKAISKINIPILGKLSNLLGWNSFSKACGYWASFLCLLFGASSIYVSGLSYSLIEIDKFPFTIYYYLMSLFFFMFILWLIKHLRLLTYRYDEHKGLERIENTIIKGADLQFYLTGEITNNTERSRDVEITYLLIDKNEKILLKNLSDEMNNLLPSHKWIYKICLNEEEANKCLKGEYKLEYYDMQFT